MLPRFRHRGKGANLIDQGEFEDCETFGTEWGTAFGIFDVE